MKSVFDQALHDAGPVFLSEFGVDVFINGFKEKAIVNDDEMVSINAAHRELSIEILPDNIDHYSQDDQVFIGEDLYIINRIIRPTTDDIFVHIELKSA